MIVLKYYLVGIKGTGMSALACMLYDLGHEVIGSDVSKNFGFEEGLFKRNSIFVNAYICCLCADDPQQIGGLQSDLQADFAAADNDFIQIFN